MKLSVYGFKDLYRSYGILQFEEGEEGRVLERLAGIGYEELRGVVEEALGGAVRGLSVARGRLYYEGQVLDMVYLRVDLDDSREYTFELYRESAMIISNTGVGDTLRDVVRLLKALVPGLRERETALVCL